MPARKPAPTPRAEPPEGRRHLAHAGPRETVARLEQIALATATARDRPKAVSVHASPLRRRIPAVDRLPKPAK